MQTALLLSVVAPVVLAAALLAVGLRPWRGDAPTSGRWALAAIVPFGAFAAYIAVRGVPALPPTDAGAWPPWLAFVAAAIGLLPRIPFAARVAARALVALATVWLVSKSRIDFAWDTTTTALWLAGATLTLTALWTVLERRAEQLRGSALPVALTVWGTGAATVLGLSGSALLAQTLGGATAALGVAAALGVWRQSLDVSRAIVGPSVVIVGGLVLAGLHYAEVGALGAAFVAAGALVVGLLPLDKAGLRSTAVVAAVMIVTSGVAVATSAWPTDAPADEATDGASDDDYGYE